MAKNYNVIRATNIGPIFRSKLIILPKTVTSDGLDSELTIIKIIPHIE